MGLRACVLVTTLAASFAVSSTQTLAQEKTTTQKIGDVGEYAMPSLVLAIALAHTDSKGVGQFALASATTLGLVNILKQTIDSRRPNGGHRSFPSGHTASAFMSAAFLQRRYGWTYGLPAYAAATFVGYSRVHTKQHWTRDVVASAALGIGSNFVFTHRYRRVTIAPTAGPEGAGVAMQITW